MTFAVPDIVSLTERLSRWEKAEYTFAFLVALACFGEYVADFTKWWQRGGSWSYLGELPDRKDKLAKLSTLLLITALVAEAVCLFRTNQLSAEITGSLNELAENSARKATKANEDADTAITKSADAERRLSEITRQADILSGQLRDLKSQVKLQTPRWQLLEAGKSEFISTLRPFAGQSIVVVDCGLNPDPEPYRLAQDILYFIGNAESSAHWKYDYRRWSRCGPGGGTSYGGNRITVNAEASEEINRAAKALNDVLNTLGIYTVNIPTGPDPYGNLERFRGPDSPEVMASRDRDSIFLLVGSNPMFNVSGFKKSKPKKR